MGDVNLFFFFLNHSFFQHSGSRAVQKITPAVLGRRRGYTPDKSAVHPTATQRQTAICTQTYKFPLCPMCMSLNCVRKPENQEGTHAHTGRTSWGTWESNLEPSCFEMTVLTTELHCTAHLNHTIHDYKLQYNCASISDFLAISNYLFVLVLDGSNKVLRNSFRIADPDMSR